jgi:hypothetical protein
MFGLLKIVGGVRERLTCARRGRGRDCAPAALDLALQGGPSTSPLEVERAAAVLVPGDGAPAHPVGKSRASFGSL